MALYGPSKYWWVKKKLINENTDGKKSVLSKRKQSDFLIYEKAYYYHEDYTFDIPSTRITSLPNKE